MYLVGYISNGRITLFVVVVSVHLPNSGPGVCRASRSPGNHRLSNFDVGRPAEPTH